MDDANIESMTLTAAFVGQSAEQKSTVLRILKETLGSVSSLAVYTFDSTRSFSFTFFERQFRADILLLQADPQSYELGRKVRDRDIHCTIIFLAGQLDGILPSLAAMPIGFQLKTGRDNSLREDLKLAYTHLRNLEAYTEGTVQSNGQAMFHHETKFQMLCLPYHEIDCFESDLRRVIVHKSDTSCESFVGKLNEVQERCVDGFYRTHQSYLVNISHIERIEKAQRRIVFFSGNEAFISRQNYLDFIKTYEALSVEVTLQ